MAEHIVKPLGHLAQDLTGKRFSRLFVQRYAGYRDGKQTMWSCLCDCGAVKDISGNSLKRGMTLSCGCLNRELSKRRATSHGMARSKLYSSWRNLEKVWWVLFRHGINLESWIRDWANW